MMDLFFGARKPTRKSPARKSRPKRKSSPKRRASPKRRTPIRRKSPKRAAPVQCRKGLSLAKLRKLARENGVNVYSEQMTNKKAKLVGCTTLMKRLREAGLADLYRKMPMVKVQDDVSIDDLSIDDVIPDMDSEEVFEGPQMIPDMVPSVSDMVLGQCGKEQIFLDGKCVDIKDLKRTQCVGDELIWNALMKPPRCTRKPVGPQMANVVDPSCDADFQKFKKASPKEAAKYLGYAMGTGPCTSRAFVSVDEDDEEKLDSVGELFYGRRAMGGARPKMTQKLVGEIMVKGRLHKVFRGKQGGLYYMKGKSGTKVYIDPSRKTKKPSKK